mgnify:CR=1 FL=1
MVDSDEESEDELLDFADKIGINTSAIRNHGGLNKLIQRRAKRFALASHYAKLLQRRYRIKAAKNEFARLALEKENRFVHAEATLMQVRIFPILKSGYDDSILHNYNANYYSLTKTS